MSGSEEGKSSEVVIIRRRSGEDEGKHHGGVWKIAYADFMTAMMAFFLVMWLINSTDKKTLTQVATYFNPMRLTDKKPNPKGLHEPDAAESNDKVPGKDKAAPKNMKGKDSVSKGATKHDESEVGEVRSRGTPFQQGNETSEDNRSGAGGETERNVPQTTGRAFRDPFDPAFRTEIAPNERVGGLAERPQQPAPKAPGAQVVGDPASDAGQLQSSEIAKGAMKDAAGDGRDPGKDAREAASAGGRETRDGREPAREAGADGRQGGAREGRESGNDAKVAANASREAGIGRETREAKAAQEAREAKEAKDAKDAKDAREAKAAREAAERADAVQLETAIRKAVAEALPGTFPNIDVTVTADGVLISLTDDYEFGMFAIASAEPRPAMVVVMDKLARILMSRTEPLVVRGHTDRRKYRTQAYDNWRLSAARAHMAYLMLARGGIDEKRFERIEGYADRNLRVQHDPEAAQNRRIEILLRKQMP